MRLAYKYLYDGEDVQEFEVKEARAADVADVSRIASSGSYKAMRRMAEAVCASINGNADPAFVKNAIQNMPMLSVYQIVCFGMAYTHGTEKVPGSYRCPSCGHVSVYGETEDGDFSDRLEDLVPEEQEGYGVEVELQSPIAVRNKSTKEVIEEVSSVYLRWPTVADWIRAEQKWPDDSGNQTFAVFAGAVEKVNGKPVTDQWRHGYAEAAFRGLTLRDMRSVSRAVSSGGIGIEVDRTCFKCHKEWKADVDMSAFFSSGL